MQVGIGSGRFLAWSPQEQHRLSPARVLQDERVPANARAVPAQRHRACAPH